MSFLTPLYMAGLAAVTLPILFHMIRRTPKGKVPFSTLMFLDPSPPRVTKRSAIEHWLLLLLRAAAVTLLAIAFSRPFLRLSEDQTVAGDSKRTAILVDISASMRRDGMWAQAVEHVKEVLGEAGPLDEVAIIGFDRELHSLVSFEEWSGLESAAREAYVRQKLSTLKPGWLGTDLGQVVPAAVTTLLDHEESTETVTSAELVLISDLQRGSRSDSLQGFNWPDSVTVRVRKLESESIDNSSVQIVGTTIDADGLRIRVDNEQDSTPERFDLLAEAVDPEPVSNEATDVVQTIPTAADSETEILPATHRREVPQWSIRDIHVPPGQNRVVRLSDLPDNRSAFRLTLTGDSVAFDNEAWFVRPSPPIVTVRYLGDGSVDDAQSLRYYLERAFLTTPAREIDFVGDDVGFIGNGRAKLTVVARPVSDTELEQLKVEFRDGGSVLVVGSTPELCRLAFQIANTARGLESTSITEASVDGYAMLGDVELSHWLFEPFNDAQLSDFTKLPVWHHRSVAVAGVPVRNKVAFATVLATFDSGDPAVIQIDDYPRANSRRGSLTLFTFGWHGEDSRFVLSSKFVPMMNHLVDRLAGTDRETPRLTVGGAIPVRDVIRGTADDVQITMPSGTRSTVSVDSTLKLNEPGVFRLAWAGSDGLQATSIAVNSDPLESQTSPLGLDELRALGVPLLDANASAETTDEKRQLQARELESRQRIWQWIILAGALILLAETWLAGRLAQAGTQEQAGS